MIQFLPLIIFALALICEFIDSHLGGGYGTILTPLFLLLGIPRLAVVHSILVSEIATGFEAGAVYKSFKKIDIKSVLALSVTAGIGSIIGTFAGIGVSAFIISAYIGFLVLALGLLMLINFRAKKYKKRNAVALGGLIGFNKALTGGGFGPISVAGLNASGMETKTSLGTTLLAEGITCTISLALYMYLGVFTILPSLIIPLVLGAVIGSYLGSRQTKIAKSEGFAKKVGLTVSLIGLFLLLKIFVL